VIEILDESRCTACNICVSACPTNVFEAVPGGMPRIARQHDCQTCYMCELYCPEDALFVAPLADRTAQVHELQLERPELLGSYRAAIGWGRGRESTARLDASYHLLRRA
jgi:NAD-dependent dihydropyrimidine dehydrogenase PreA subunit